MLNANGVNPKRATDFRGMGLKTVAAQSNRSDSVPLPAATARLDSLQRTADSNAKANSNALLMSRAKTDAQIPAGAKYWNETNSMKTCFGQDPNDSMDSGHFEKRCFAGR